MINFIKKIFCITDERLDKKRKLSKGMVGTQGTSWSQKSECCFAKESEECSREATEDELRNESMYSSEIQFFEICGDSVIYHTTAANCIKTYTKREFKNFSWVIAESRVVIGGVIYRYELQNGYMGGISIYFHTKENAEKYLRAILQFTKDNIPQAHCYCENLIKK